MGKADSITKVYMKNSRVFADAFNFYLFGGRQVIDPEKLIELDPAEIGILSEENGQKEAVQKYRDVLKNAEIRMDGEATYVLLGIESQKKTHYAMPVRNMVYDALQYARQAEEIARRHREAKEFRGRSSGEYLSGFFKEDKLTPVITLVIHFAPEAWDGICNQFKTGNGIY